MLRWICDHTRREQIRNDNIRDKLKITSIQEKLVQHYLRSLGHIQQRPTEAPVHSSILSRPENKIKRRDRSKLT
jgi:hypothetical protein